MCDLGLAAESEIEQLIDRTTHLFKNPRSRIIKMKTCSKCKVEKSIESFDKNKSNRLGLHSQCKQCRKINRQENAEKIYLSNKAYKEANKESIAEYMKKYRQDNKKVIAEYRQANKKRISYRAAAYRKENLDKIIARERLYRKNNPEINKLKWHKRRALKSNSGGKLSKGLSEKLFKLQKGKCPCCRKPLGKDYHMDHMQPLSKGGRNEDSNIQLLRAECNLQKGSKDDFEFMQLRGFLL